MKRNLAISIGINKYEFSQPLKYAKRDAELMRDFLVKEAGFEQVLFCSDESPNINGKSTRASFVNLRRVLRAMFEKPFMEAGDNFWFFFSGHGMRHNGCDYLMACDSDPGDVAGTAISISYVTEQLRRCGADNVVLILDACRSQGSKSGEGIGYQAAQVAREKGVITIFSCSPDELSYEINDLQQGIFTKALLEGLGAQGRCATVERLNHYLNGRVPDLIRQYKKGDTSRQTPYIIAEPASKYHLILCPQYATLNDVATMKIDALSAELHQDFDIAEQLWIRVLAASPSFDMDAIKALKRIGIAETQPAAIPYQPSSKNTAATDKFPEPSPPNPTPIEPDVPLKSERGADVAPMKFDASIAEIHQDLNLAEQLWIRVMAAFPSFDMDAIKGLKRIAVAKIQPAAIPYQPSSKNTAATDKSPEAAPSHPTPRPAVPILNQPNSENPAKTNKSPQPAPLHPTPCTTLTDVGTMKYDAFSAEVRQDFDLAEQLWIRVLAASPIADRDAIKGLERIAVAKIQPAAIPYQPSSKNSAKTEKSPEPAPPNPTPIKPDVTLKSERGVDYTKLRDLLASGKWEEADEETTKKMLEVAGRTEEGRLRSEDIDRFPCEDLRTIDQLWVKYSNGRFGFSVQKRIYGSLGGTRYNNTKIWEAFGDRVGWRVNKEWLLYKYLKFNTKAPPGHLPAGRGLYLWLVFEGVWLDGGGSLLSRRDL